MLSRHRLASSLWVAVISAVSCSTASALAQDKSDEDSKPKLSVGDPAPAVQVEQFIKGDGVKEFKPGHVYVVEFWATWCGPCIASMPHLSELQKKFKDKATFISVNIWEDKEYNDETSKKVKEFVEKNDAKMGYTVAYDGAAQKMDEAYMQAAGQNGIPCAFVVTTDAKIGYIGHPMDKDFEGTIQQLVDGKFDMAKAVAAHEARVKREAEFEKNFRKFRAMMNEARELVEDGEVDQGLAKLEEASKLMPDSDPTQIEMQKFGLLMEAEEHERAYAIGRKLVAGPAKDNPQLLNGIAWSIVDPEAGIEKPDLLLAFKAAELAVELTESKDAAIMDTLARCYWIKGDKAKAIELQMVAVELSKDQPGMHEALKKVLDEYKQ